MRIQTDPIRDASERDWVVIRRDLTALGLDGEEWSYRTDAELHWDEDAQQWLVDLRPDDLVAGLAPGGTVTVRRTPADRGDIMDAAGKPFSFHKHGDPDANEENDLHQPEKQVNPGHVGHQAFGSKYKNENVHRNQ